MPYFTVGHTESYEQYLNEYAANNDTPLKIGKMVSTVDETYAGGIVFETEREARLYLDKYELAGMYSVYELNASSEDVYWSEPDGFFRLQNSAPIRRIR